VPLLPLETSVVICFSMLQTSSPVTKKPIG
jgi:hypothetical protein